LYGIIDDPFLPFPFPTDEYDEDESESLLIAPSRSGRGHNGCEHGVKRMLNSVFAKTTDERLVVHCRLTGGRLHSDLEAIGRGPKHGREQKLRQRVS
jgi:hypothetical protein